MRNVAVAAQLMWAGKEVSCQRSIRMVTWSVMRLWLASVTQRYCCLDLECSCSSTVMARSPCVSQ
jgi:hypothetical protein